MKWTHFKFSNIHYWIPLIVDNLQCYDAPFGEWVSVRSDCSFVHEKFLVFGLHCNLGSIFFQTIVHNNGNSDRKATRYHKYQTRRANGKSNSNLKYRDTVWILEIRESECVVFNFTALKRIVYCWVSDLSKSHLD